MASPWTEAQVDDLERLRAHEGKDWPEVAKAIGKPISACRQKFQTLGFALTPEARRAMRSRTKTTLLPIIAELNRQIRTLQNGLQTKDLTIAALRSQVAELQRRLEHIAPRSVNYKVNWDQFARQECEERLRVRTTSSIEPIVSAGVP